MQTFNEAYLIDLDEYYCEDCAPKTARKVELKGTEPEYCNDCELILYPGKVN